MGESALSIFDIIDHELGVIKSSRVTSWRMQWDDSWSIILTPEEAEEAIRFLPLSQRCEPLAYSDEHNAIGIYHGVKLLVSKLRCKECGQILTDNHA